MPLRKPEAHAYEFIENGIVHRPTKAEFTHHPGRTNIEWSNRGRTGDVLPNGDEYDFEEVCEMAQKLLNERAKK